MKISIITVSYNSEAFIKEAIESVWAQSYSDIEYIVVDGASRDNTIAIVSSFEGLFRGNLKVLSESDIGIYDAMNKGINLATGDVLGFLNSDDKFANSEIVAKIAASFEQSGSDIVYGNITYVDKFDTSKVIRCWRSGLVPKHGMKFGWHPPHPAFYVRREKLIKAGCFDLRYKIGADYEQMLRLIHRHQFTLQYLPEVFVRMRVGGVSNRSLSNIIKANRECMRAWRDNGLNASPLLVPTKLASKLTQYFFKNEITSSL